MRRFALLVCLLWLATAPVSGAELTGTVHVASRPAQHAVVWLAAPGAPPYRGQFVLGASYARGSPYLSPRFAVGRQALSGADVRWAHPSGLQARGEFLKGHCIKSHSIDVSATYSFRMDR